MFKRFVSSALALLAFSTVIHAAESLLVLSKGDHTLAIVDAATLKVVGKAPVGEDPHEVIASSDGRYAYVSNYGGGRYNTLALIDLVTRRPVKSIDLGPLRGPHGLTFVGGKTWFTAEGAKAIGRYDPATQHVDWILGTGQNRTHMIWVSQDMNTIYTTNVASGTVTIMEHHAPVAPPQPPPNAPGQGPRPPMGPPGGDWNETVVPVGHGSEGFDITPDHREMWVANAGEGTISIIDLATKNVKETVRANIPGANRLKFTPDGKLVFISLLGPPPGTNASAGSASSGIVVLNRETHNEMKRLPAQGCAGIEIQPDGSRVFVACTAGNYVAVVDTKTLEMTGKIDAGPGPDGMAWTNIPQ